MAQLLVGGTIIFNKGGQHAHKMERKPMTRRDQEPIVRGSGTPDGSTYSQNLFTVAFVSGDGIAKSDLIRRPEGAEDLRPNIEDVFGVALNLDNHSAESRQLPTIAGKQLTGTDFLSTLSNDINSYLDISLSRFTSLTGLRQRDGLYRRS
ncbi:MAG: hypothetical protein Q9218_003797 [Villophora microphyllina]